MSIVIRESRFAIAQFARICGNVNLRCLLNPTGRLMLKTKNKSGGAEC